MVFPQSPSPSFLTVPGEGFAEPFHLTPGKWILHLRAEGVLLVREQQSPHGPRVLVSSCFLCRVNSCHFSSSGLSGAAASGLL